MILRVTLEEGRRSTWAERAAPKTRVKGPWTRQRVRPKRPPEPSPAIKPRRPKDLRTKRRARPRISWARPRTSSNSLNKAGERRSEEHDHGNRTGQETPLGRRVPGRHRPAPRPA